jgi:hypothetical protein
MKPNEYHDIIQSIKEEHERMEREDSERTVCEVKKLGQCYFDDRIEQKLLAAYRALIYYRNDNGEQDRLMSLRQEIERVKQRLIEKFV